jgi:hypothetical protein
MNRPLYGIRADYDRDTMVVYQAYASNIALPAVEKQTFASPFSFRRMTWIKPSFLWLMARSNWGQKSGQEHILAIRIKRSGWDLALNEAVLTHPESSVFPNAAEWRRQFDAARVHVQWDPERSIRGSKLQYFSIQVGISRYLIEEYVKNWIVSIEDLTPLVRKLHRLRRQGDYKHASRQVPPERPYPVSREIAHRLMMNT